MKVILVALLVLAVGTGPLLAQVPPSAPAPPVAAQPMDIQALLARIAELEAQQLALQQQQFAFYQQTQTDWAGRWQTFATKWVPWIATSVSTYLAIKANKK